MAGETALDASVAIRYLNGDAMPTAASYAVARVIALPNIVLPLPVVAKLLFGAETSVLPHPNPPLSKGREPDFLFPRFIRGD